VRGVDDEEETEEEEEEEEAEAGRSLESSSNAVWTASDEDSRRDSTVMEERSID